MKNLQETYEVIQGNTRNISRKLIAYVKETHHICQGNTSDVKKHIGYVKKPFIYITDTHQIFLGQPSDISRTPIKYLHDTY